MAEQLGLYVNPANLKFMYYFIDSNGQYRYKYGELRRRDDFDIELDYCYLSAEIIKDKEKDKIIKIAQLNHGYQKEDGVMHGLLHGLLTVEYEYIMQKIDPDFLNKPILKKPTDARLVNWLNSA